MVITGIGILNIELAKKVWILPGQSCTAFDVSSANYTFEVQAMSDEKISFIHPAVFTIGPRVDDEASLLKYAKLIAELAEANADLAKKKAGWVGLRKCKWRRWNLPRLLH